MVTQRLIFSVLMASVLSFLMSAFVTWMNIGFGLHYLQRWMDAFVLAWPSAAFISYLFGPSVQQLSHDLNTRLIQMTGRT